MTRSPSGTVAWISGAVLVLAGSLPVAMLAQRTPTTASAAPLVFDSVTVVDVEHGKLVPLQRVIIVGGRIQAVGNVGRVTVPAVAQVVNASGKFLIPGLWDMHAHVAGAAQVYSLLVANGVTGIREMASAWPAEFDTIVAQRRAIAQGTLVGPRIVATSHDFYSPVCSRQEIGAFAASIMGVPGTSDSATLANLASALPLDAAGCFRLNSNVVATPDEVRRLVDMLQAGGVDFVKSHNISNRAVYLAFLAEARRLGIPAIGHLNGSDGRALMESEASDSGLRSVEHINEMACWQDERNGSNAVPLPDSIAERQCATVAARFTHNGTWLVPTLYVFNYPIFGPVDMAAVFNRAVAIAHRAGIPMLAGTDAFTQPKRKTQALESALHQELALLVGVGFTPLEALQAATLNPAKFFGATDSLGTIAAGKVADLVLLGADPLIDITNTTKIAAVVTNGRYFDRAALDGLLAAARRKTPP